MQQDTNDSVIVRLSLHRRDGVDANCIFLHFGKPIQDSLTFQLDVLRMTSHRRDFNLDCLHVKIILPST